MAAIDFTLSNGEQSSQKSLHWSSNLVKQTSFEYHTLTNQYERALWSVGKVLVPYDCDSCFPVYGFGGKLNQKGSDYCFPLNGNLDSPSMQGLDKVLKTYRQTLPNIQFTKEALFAPVLNTFKQQVEKNVNTYSVLMLLTAGHVDDMAETKDVLVELSALPCSVIIIGVGDRFQRSSMNELDGDDGVLHNSKGQAIKRDIV